MRKEYFTLLVIALGYILGGCKEERDGGWPAFKWKVESVSNYDEIKVGIDKNSNVIVELYSNAGEVILNATNYNPWICDIKVGDIWEKEKSTKESDWHNRTYEWGTINIDGHIANLRFSDLSEEYKDIPINIYLEDGDAFSSIFIKRMTEEQ